LRPPRWSWTIPRLAHFVTQNVEHEADAAPHYGPTAVLDNRGAITNLARSIAGNICTGRYPITRSDHPCNRVPEVPIRDTPNVV
jgi:hypothetical protein